MNGMKLLKSLQAWLIDRKWGEWSLVCLYLSLGSGIVVGLHYSPSEPFYSTSSLEILVPYGSWFRSMHFYTSQLFLLFGIVHFIVAFNKAESYSNKPYIFLVLCLPVIVLLLFTGYVLRHDATGFSAGMIAENILESVPFIGPLLNRLLFSISEDGLQRLYLHHVFSFDLLLLVLAWDHLRRYRVRVSNHLPFLAIILITCLIVAAPIDPETLGVNYITGPWFFLGLQELLRYTPPFFAGFIVPAALITSLAILRRQHKSFKMNLVFVIGWLIVYLVLSVMALTMHT